MTSRRPPGIADSFPAQPWLKFMHFWTPWATQQGRELRDTVAPVTELLSAHLRPRQLREPAPVQGLASGMCAGPLYVQ